MPVGACHRVRQRRYPVAGHDGLLLLGRSWSVRRASYFIAPKRLSNEFGGKIGAEPAT
jgi:hypothetical protein